MKPVEIYSFELSVEQQLRLAASGETIPVTDRDQVIAEPTPHKENQGPFTTDAFLADAVRSGVLTPPAAVSTQPPAAIPAAQLDETLNEELDKNRRDK